MKLSRLAARNPHAGDGKPGLASLSSSQPGLPNTSTGPSPRVDQPGACQETAPGTFLHTGCTREESRLGCQLAWSHNLGEYTPGEYMTAALAYRGAGDLTRAHWCEAQIRVLARRKRLL